MKFYGGTRALNYLKWVDSQLTQGEIFKSLKRWKWFIADARISRLPRKSRTNFSLRARLDFFLTSAYYIQANRMEGVYAEFGVHEASTFRMALRTLGKSGPARLSKFLAFDSFQGMPEPKGIDRGKLWRKGINMTSVQEFRSLVRRDLERVEVVEGFFEESLPRFDWPENQKVVVAYLDCDYYSSTVTCLSFLSDKLEHGALLVFDDWNLYFGDPLRGQKRAFSEFREGNPNLLFEEFVDIGTLGKSFIVLHRSLIGTDVL